MLIQGLQTFGVTETPGPGSNPVIMSWAKELGAAVDATYKTDMTAWCGLWAGIIAKRAGKPVVAQPLWARNWAKWGEPAKVPMLGDTLVFKRATGGHVGLYVGEDATCFHVLGGNQGDKVSIVRIPKGRLIAARRLYTSTPANVRRVMLSSKGAVSTNEA